MTEREELIRLRAENRHLRQRCGLIAQLEDYATATLRMPRGYVQAFAAISHMAHYGVRRPSDASTHTGKLQSRPPFHDAGAYQALRAEVKWLERRATVLEGKADRATDRVA